MKKYCTCGHAYEAHNLRLPTWPPLKTTFAPGDYSTVSTPCEVNTGCGCQNYTDRTTGQPKRLKKPKTEPHTLCAKCGHARNWHCTAQRRTANLPPSEWRVFEREGRFHPCQHTTESVYNQCSTSACARPVDGEFCQCTKFVAAIPKGPKLVAAKRRSKKTFDPDQLALFELLESSLEQPR
jgi:hypothetical protein